MNKLKRYKNDQPAKAKRYWRLYYREVAESNSQVLDEYWLPVANSRWRTSVKEIKRWRRACGE